MKALNNPPKYTAEQIDEIIERMKTLRLRWLRFVEIEIESRQKSPTTFPRYGKAEASAEVRRALP